MLNSSSLPRLADMLQGSDRIPYDADFTVGKNWYTNRGSGPLKYQSEST